MAGAEDTIYLCNFRVSVDGDWLCLKELAEGTSGGTASAAQPLDGEKLSSPSSPESPQCAGADTDPAQSPPGYPLAAVPNGPPPSGGAARLAAISGLPPGLFAPYVPLSCGPCTLYTFTSHLTTGRALHTFRFKSKFLFVLAQNIFKLYQEIFLLLGFKCNLFILKVSVSSSRFLGFKPNR